MNFTELSHIDAERLKVFCHRLMTDTQGSRRADGTAELRKSTTETVIKTGKHFHLHRGHSIGPLPKNGAVQPQFEQQTLHASRALYACADILPY
ncbi:hypothetical protein CEV33_4018 [Brucella grignonensis]|uniref:Uncharacterized protein n=1 Tax=Brucella grignonensis TaxID=94627 RepID=A0A256FPX0_9HYPH|nr:hypothetical protein CEV33_4018 [Brucella grignonensis]